MAGKSKDAIKIISLGKNTDNLTVQKSNNLLTLCKSEMVLNEFKILDIYLGRIDSHNSDKRTVIFSKGELENILGRTQISKNELDKMLTHLMTPLKLVDSDYKKRKNSLKKINLFSMAECEADDDGLWQISLTCTPEAMEYIFNIENIGYLRYKLKNIINLTSRYSYILFLYLENNRTKHLEWEVSLKELKTILNCTAETYDNFTNFNKFILKKAHKEINEKTECCFTYENIRRGRRVKKIKFTLESKNMFIDECVNRYDEEESKYKSESIEFLAEACNNEFNEAEMNVIFTLMSTSDRAFTDEYGADIAKYKYLMHQYSLLNLESEKTQINNRFMYFKAMLRNDLLKKNNNTKKNK